MMAEDIKFTDDELYEIEKQFDIVSGQTRMAFAGIIRSINMPEKCPSEENLTALMKQTIDEFHSACETFMNIRIKAKAMRGN